MGNSIIQNTYKREITDYETGEVKEEIKTTIFQKNLGAEPDFIKIYLEHIAIIQNVKTAFMPILLEVLKSATFANRSDKNGGMVVRTDGLARDIIAESCGCSSAWVVRALTEFKNKKFLLPMPYRGAYQLNPYFFGKGKWQDIANIRANFEYDVDEGVRLAHLEIKERKNANLEADKNRAIAREQARNDREIAREQARNDREIA